MSGNVPKSTVCGTRWLKTGDAGERLFCAGFLVSETVAADHDRDQTCNLRDGAGEKALDCVKAGIERSFLSTNGEWGKDETLSTTSGGFSEIEAIANRMGGGKFDLSQIQHETLRQ